MNDNYDSMKIEFEHENFYGVRSKNSNEFIREFMTSLCNHYNLASGLDKHSSKYSELIRNLKTFTKEELINLLTDKTINRCKLAR